MQDRHPEVRAVFLVGFMGAGKTSVGRALSSQLGWPFEDLDDRIRSREGRSIDAIFRESGEAEFRRIECATLLDMVATLNDLPRVIGLGGGAFAQELDKALAQPGSVTVFLDASVEELWRRCEQDVHSRPLQRQEQQFRALCDKRRPQYMKASLHVNTSGKTVEEVASELREKLGLTRNIDPKES
jgi:shikimate kinase